MFVFNSCTFFFSFLFSLPLPQSSLILKIFEFPFSVSSAIGCYECDSSKNFTCTEFWDPNLDVTLPYLSPDCSHVFEVRETSNFPRNQLLKLVEFEFLPRPPTASRWLACSTASLERSASALQRHGEITASTSRGRGTFRYEEKIWKIDTVVFKNGIFYCCCCCRRCRCCCGWSFFVAYLAFLVNLNGKRILLK